MVLSSQHQLQARIVELEASQDEAQLYRSRLEVSLILSFPYVALCALSYLHLRCINFHLRQ